MAVTWNKDTDYKKLMQEAAAAGDYQSAARYEQQRNAKIQANAATDPNYKYANDVSTNYAQYLHSDYQGTGTHNDAGMSASDLDLLNTYKTAYNNAASMGDEAGKQAAHAAAEALRSQYGYSGGTDGSGYISLNTTPTPTGGTTMPTFDYNVSKPAYTSNYSARIDELLNQILNREKFSYNAEEDPLYQQYKTQYNREGNRAMNDTLAAAASGAGGMNSYAVTAAQQANNYYASQMGDKIPELYQLAYDMYLTDIDQQVRDLGLLQDMDDSQYSRYRDTMSDWYNDRDFAYGVYRDDMGDYQWNKSFDYNASRDQVADNQWKQTFDHTVLQDDIYNKFRQEQADISNNQWQQSFDREGDQWQQSFDREGSNTAYDKAMDLLNSGTMPTADQLAAAGMTTDQAQAILAYVKLGYDKSLSLGSYAPKDTGSGGGGGDDDDDPKPSAKPDPEPDDGPSVDWLREKATDIGLGLIDAETIVDIKKAGGLIEDADGTLVWANGWTMKNWRDKLTDAKSSPFMTWQMHNSY